MSDLISRQAAIDALTKHEIELPIYAPRETDVFWDDAIDCCVSEIDALPSAQPEIIRCKDCIYYRQEIDMCDEPYSTAHNVVHEDDYCSRAERKTDEQTN